MLRAFFPQIRGSRAATIGETRSSRSTPYPRTSQSWCQVRLRRAYGGQPSYAHCVARPGWLCQPSTYVPPLGGLRRIPYLRCWHARLRRAYGGQPSYATAWLAPAGCASRSLPQRGSEGWCPESGSNRHGCYPQDFESSASANSAIRAWEEMRTVVPDRKLSTEFSRGPGAGRSVKPDLDFTAGRGCALRSLGEAARKQRKGILR